MSYFPQLNASGLTVQRPYQTTQEALTTSEDQPTGRRLASSWRLNPLSRFDLAYAHLTDAELATLEAFFDSMKGRYGEFTYLDPSGNLCQYSEDFSQADWIKTALTVGGAQADPYGGSKATALTATSADSWMSADVIPNGGASGFVLCASVWAKAQSAGQQLQIGFQDSTLSAMIGASTWDLPQGTWKRIWHGVTLATNNNIRAVIGGNGTWNSTVIHLFGSQCAPMPGPGGYQKSPGNYGLHAKCRFDTDALPVRYLGPNQNAVSLSVVEYS